MTAGQLKWRNDELREELDMANLKIAKLEAKQKLPHCTNREKWDCKHFQKAYNAKRIKAGYYKDYYDKNMKGGG